MLTRRLPTLFLMLVTLALTMNGSILPATGHDDGDDRDDGKVARFATLPKPGPGHPEGITADADGNIYVSTFDFSQPNNIYVFGRDGRLRGNRTVTLGPGSLPLGLAVRGHSLYVADFGTGNVLKFDLPLTTGDLATETIHVCDHPTTECALNALEFDGAGNVYVSDSFGGRVFKIAPGTPPVVTTFLADEMLKPGPHGFPPFGANGLAFNAAGTQLFIANTADDRILKYDLATRILSPFAESINGADGIAFDRKGRLWVCANQADELVALNNRGRVVERVGSFRGIGGDGAVKGLLFPASLVFSRGAIYVTNLALALTPAEGDEPEEDVTTFTVSRIELD
jgi:sugar lactone lactonase YvrE